MRNISKCLSGKQSKTSLVIGTQWGDEGKGKIVDVLAKDYDYVARYNGGANAGHTVVADGHKYAFHLLPCGILYPQCKNVLGNGCVISLESMFEELEQLDTNGIDYKGRLIVSDRAHLVTSMQIEADSKIEDTKKGTKQFLGTTKRGIGPTYSTKAMRVGLRAGDLNNWEGFIHKYNLLEKYFEQHFNIEIDRDVELEKFRLLKNRLESDNMVQDTVLLMNKILNNDKQRLLVEGANAQMLDIDFGTYPYVTSSHTWAGGVATGLGIPAHSIQTTLGTVKAYTTRVGEGPFPTCLDNEIGQQLQDVGHEYGATTGRPRKCGWLDLVVIKYTHMLNDLTSINLTKLDVLTGIPSIKIAVAYKYKGQLLESMPSDLNVLSDIEIVYQTMEGWTEDITHCTQFQQLPHNAQQYVKAIETIVGIPVSWIGVGPHRDQTICRF